MRNCLAHKLMDMWCLYFPPGALGFFLNIRLSPQGEWWRVLLITYPLEHREGESDLIVYSAPITAPLFIKDYQS